MTNERRQHPRLSIAVEVDFGSEHNFYSAKTRDISVGGLFIETDVPLPIGMRIQVDLKFGQSRIKVDAEVTWMLVGAQQETTGVGVRFVDLPAPSKYRIEQFMALREPMTFRMIESDDEKE